MITMEEKKPETVREDEQIIFALDIGTRSVIGLVGRKEGQTLRVLAAQVEEYQSRAVVDGQIENIEETAKTAGIVKQRLEESLGFPLKNVYIAAAGRTLETQRGEFEMEVHGDAIDEAFLSELEAGAVTLARDALFSGREEDTAFFCTGHSVVKYELDGYEMSTLLGHRGKVAHVEVIATFLPREVVESLYSTMRRIGLAVAGLTLEPIAAMNAVIPADIRMLNLALADIGAGTSDIAVCNSGYVCAYTMATVAGDEITEAIMREYLVDFATAEAIKRDVARGQSVVTFENILGLSVEEPAEQILQKLAPVMQELCSIICERILEANGKPPAAVFLTGGGSRIPGLCQLVAEGLSMTESRVSVGGSSYMKKVVASDCDIFGSEYATPVGIALTAASGQGLDAFTVTINDTKLRLVDNWDMTLLDTLLISGVKYSQIMGHVGKSISFELNGERRVVRGKPSVQAVVTMNGKPVSLADKVHPGDVIAFEPAKPGEDARPLLSQVVEGFSCFPVFFNDVEVQVGTLVTVNGVRAAEDMPIENMDTLVCETISTVQDLCDQMDVDFRQVTVNGEEVEDPLAPLHSGDRLQIEAGSASPSFDPELLEDPPPEEGKPEPIPFAPPAADEDPVINRLKEGDIHVTLNGEKIFVGRRKDGSPHQFIELFNYIDIDPKNPQGDIILRLNGHEASYLDPVADGDRVEIFWDKNIKETV